MNNNRKHTNRTSARQGAQAASAEPLKIGASTPFDFSARNLTAYGGLLPVATMLEKLGFQQLVEETLEAYIRLGPLFGNLKACRRWPEHQ